MGTLVGLSSASVYPESTAHAFGYASWWLVAGACLLTLPAWILARAEKLERVSGTVGSRTG